MASLLMMIFSISVLLLPHMTFTARVNVGIVNGTEAKPHSRPYMVSIQKDETHICGGFLISDEFVLTAAHCWNEYNKLTVVVGAHVLRNITNSDRFNVTHYIQHKSYIPAQPWNDIMLLKLNEKVKLNNEVQWISLPKKSDVKADTLCSVAGWGRLSTNGPISNCLMEANVYIMNNTECSKKWKTSIFNVNQMMCTHGHGGSCLYDSGGPLVCGNTAVGITSFGYRYQCNSPEHPNVYVKISPYLTWIHNQMRNPERFHGK